MVIPDTWEVFTPSRSAQGREMLSWFNVVHLAGRRVPAVDPDSTDRVSVVLVPGFLTGDWSLVPFARELRRAGFPTVRSGITWNTGCTEAMVDLLERRLERTVATLGRPVALVGQSRGGTLSRMVAARRP